MQKRTGKGERGKGTMIKCGGGGGAIPHALGAFIVLSSREEVRKEGEEKGGEGKEKKFLRRSRV